MNDDATPEGSDQEAAAGQYAPRRSAAASSARRRVAATIIPLGLVVILGFGSWAYGRWPAVSGHGNAMCAPAQAAPLLVWGGSFVNDRAVPLHVSSLAAHEPEGLHLDSVWMLTSDGPYTIPERVGPDLEEIADRLPSGGIDVAPGEHVALLASVSVDRDRGASKAVADGFGAVYRIGPWTHEIRTGIDVTVMPPGQRCF
ncbi:hypothetical protein M1843_10745 [Isoptericola sp. 4D.3]|uniref:Uncharacterized protein n=1 Tax=Isoptericola peretonis TaxID=2918523 RepID=A0ABT0J416_9MICO|nr:hypothetical protein [Isoptericola sp. 4D.3]